MSKRDSAHDETPAQADAEATVGALLAWYADVKRDLPWRRTRDPYAIWVSEVMLQQTRVDTVIGYYARFLQAFPTLTALAEAEEAAVLAQWSGLGYYRRARLLHAGARAAAKDGALPTRASELEQVPGIGRYTAGAIASIAHGEAAPLVDGNVARVFARLYGITDDVSRGPGQRRVWALATRLVGTKPACDDPGAFNQSLMELGATVCIPREPRCDACPVKHLCAARATGEQARLPVLKAKAAPKAWARTALVATAGERVLLARRGTGALMAGLWEPPMVDASPDGALADAERTLAALELDASSVEHAGQVVHVLSHRRMTVEVVRARLARAPQKERALGGRLAPYDAMDAVDKGSLATRPHATLTKKLIVAAD